MVARAASIKEDEPWKAIRTRPRPEDAMPDRLTPQGRRCRRGPKCGADAAHSRLPANGGDGPPAVELELRGNCHRGQGGSPALSGTISLAETIRQGHCSAVAGPSGQICRSALVAASALHEVTSDPSRLHSCLHTMIA
jgi:hypothetical protein